VAWRTDRIAPEDDGASVEEVLSTDHTIKVNSVSGLIDTDAFNAADNDSGTIEGIFFTDWQGRRRGVELIADHSGEPLDVNP
jgi:hypothetical protein